MEKTHLESGRADSTGDVAEAAWDGSAGEMSGCLWTAGATERRGDGSEDRSRAGTQMLQRMPKAREREFLPMHISGT